MGQRSLDMKSTPEGRTFVRAKSQRKTAAGDDWLFGTAAEFVDNPEMLAYVPDRQMAAWAALPYLSCLGKRRL
jgi:hypothetical protein